MALMQRFRLKGNFTDTSVNRKLNLNAEIYRKHSLIGKLINQHA